MTALAGTAMVLAPTRLLCMLGAAGDGPSSAWVRLLGGRYVAQGAAELVHPSRHVLWGSCVADALHAATMVWAVAAGVPYRRAANASTAFATLSAASLAIAARKNRASSQGVRAPLLSRAASAPRRAPA